MSHSKLEKFARMANQIGDAQCALAPKEAAEAVALHVRKFWAPKMIAQTLAALDSQTIHMGETAVAGFAILRRESAGAD